MNRHATRAPLVEVPVYTVPMPHSAQTRCTDSAERQTSQSPTTPEGWAQPSYNCFERTNLWHARHTRCCFFKTSACASPASAPDCRHRNGFVNTPPHDVWSDRHADCTAMLRLRSPRRRRSRCSCTETHRRHTLDYTPSLAPRTDSTNNQKQTPRRLSRTCLS